MPNGGRECSGGVGTTLSDGALIMLDLKNLQVADAAERTTRTELEHPATGETLFDADGNPYYVEHVGEDAPEVRALDRKHSDRRADRLRKGGGANPLSQDVLEKEAVERLTTASKGWYLPPLNGEPLAFSPANARQIFADPNFAWIGEQVAKNMRDRARFLPKVSAS
jgi:hypothetical protein